MKRNRLGLCALGFAGALLSSTAAFAGWRSSQEVVIWDVLSFANGDVSYASNTADTGQRIECESKGGSGYCLAEDQTGLTRQCSTSDSDLLAVIRSLKNDSYLSFSWDTNGHCTNIRVDNSSYTVPKK